MFKFLNNKIKNGFSLLEIIVAIFVISMGMIGVSSLLIQNIQTQYINKNTLIASQLAQEGLELVRNIRDNNWLAGDDWNNGIGEGNYIVDYTGYINSVVGIDDAKLKFREFEGFYWHNIGTPDSIFSRMITITQPELGFINVLCLVQWKIKNNTYTYEVNTVLYNWK